MQIKLSEEYKLHFNYVTVNKRASGYVDIDELLKFYKHPTNITLDLELDNKLRIWNVTANGHEIIEWFII